MLANQQGAGVTISTVSATLNQGFLPSRRVPVTHEMGAEHDLSKVMVQQQVSSLGFQMTLNVRNKVLSAYKDIMNMPV